MTGALGALGTLLGPFSPVPDVSQEGSRVTTLFVYATTVSAAVFAIVVLSVVIFVLRGARRTVAPERAERQMLTIALAVAGLTFLLLDLPLVSAAQKDLAEVYGRIPGGPEVVRVEVLAQQWAWNFRLAGNDRAFGTPDDVVSLNVLRVPEGRPVVLNLRSKDVLHAFFVPALRLKHDAHPAGTTRTWFAVREPGTYEIACSQFCGFAHYRMRGTLEVLPAQAYARWLAEESAESAFRFDPANREAAWGWEFVP